MSRGGTLRKVGRVVVGLPPLLLLSAAAVYREKHRPKLPENYTLADLTGKTVVSTGASSGIGKATVAKLQELGAVIHSGSRTQGNLDLSDISSVHNFAKSIQKCDIMLLAAAEVGTNLAETSVDGLDKTFATNHVGLQALLMELEAKHLQPSRVILVASKLERNGMVDTTVIRDTGGKKLNNRTNPTPVQHYSDTKLCNQLLVTELAQRWPNTKVFSVSPGMVDTGLWRNFPTWFQLTTWPIRKVALRTPKDGALGVIYACASDQAFTKPTGSFWVDGRVEEASEKSMDSKSAKELWRVVEELIMERRPK